MIILGIETSCDECAAAIVEDGRAILSNIVASQVPFHAPWGGVVPEIASRKHCEWISGVTSRAFSEAGLSFKDIHGVAVTARPGLTGSLLAGLNFAKAFAYMRRLPFIACDHLLAHIYAARLAGKTADYPFIGLIVSGGHTIICKVEDFDKITVLGTTVDDAAGEAFDKVSKHFGWGYPGGKYIDDLARQGDAEAYMFPLPLIHKGGGCDVSYSGLKTAVIHQRDYFRKKKAGGGESEENGGGGADLAASFQRAAVETLMRALLAAVQKTGISTVVAGGGVTANSYMRSRLSEESGINCVFPPLELCGDNGAMVAGLGYEYLSRGISSPLSVTASARSLI